jgi:hypothetical protein
VFPSSRAVKRAVGLTAWAILEDIGLDARLDERGRLVAETNVRRIAANLGIGKNTVAQHLAKLRDYGFCLHEEIRGDDSGRYELSRYVLDPSACIERFTSTPPAGSAPARSRPPRPKTSDTVAPPRPRNRDTDSSAPCPKNPDTATVSQSTVSRELGQKNKTAVAEAEQQQRAAPHGDLLRRLARLSVERPVAEALVAEHPAELVAAAVRAAGRDDVRHPAGFAVSALREGWDLSAELADERAEQARRRRAAERAAAEQHARAETEHERMHADGWAAAVSAALDDTGLATAVERVTAPVAGVGRRSLPVTRAQLLAWAAAAAGRHPHLLVSAALRHDLAVGARAAEPAPLPAPPAPERAAPDLSHRLAACAHDLDFPARSPSRGVSR